MLQEKARKSELNPVKSMDSVDRRFSVAPMMDWTTSDYRVFARTLSKNTLLYTEMVTTGALLQGNNPERFLHYNECEHPIALQLGGADAVALGKCAKMAEDYGYDEVNLNVGCPSDRVQNSLIGACLMAYPDKVKDAMRAMQDASSLPITVKHRIGLDDQEEYSVVRDFVGDVATTGVKTFIVHARNAILAGLSPKENREIPPLKYDYVYQLKKDFPDLEIIINGGIKTLEECEQHLQFVDGVMVGREAYQNPWLLSQVDSCLFGQNDRFDNRFDALMAFVPYAKQQLAKGERLMHLTRHILGLFQGEPGGKQFRRYLSEKGHKADANIDVLLEAIDLVKQHQRKG
ncbi:tRNA dihydrouridine(20/20a) synthase DusA [Marinomonas spartinae]|uniref:tRNA dihydrouridine(20/20a) synthase DusA n=1 Tax=Marinomonas spartinae TaxID=1792290 RepID=UPI0018F23C10|nr:tRNA dihydrouridine(20/20a) synthase DusA [Marinomonas spartinae]MBJ7555139.1 tRNA dihydrouridine(20/20a) synthase DusA [Marinomonas spartinae]